MRAILLLLIGLFVLLSACKKDSRNVNIESSSYQIENISLPDGLVGETGAIEFLPDGRLVACFLRGEIMIYDPQKSIWSVFASGLHEPLGLMIVNEYEMMVMQRPELTRDVYKRQLYPNLKWLYTAVR